VQLVRRIFILVKIFLFSPRLIERVQKIGPALLTPINTALDTLASVSCDALPATELRNLWYQLNFWKKVIDFIKNPYLLSRWVWVIGITLFISVYVYIATLFSFAYYGIARIVHITYSWPDAIVTSLFIPFFLSDLPKTFVLRIIGALQCTLVLAVGIGTFLTFLRRQLDAIRTAANHINSRFTEKSIYEKYVILEEKVSSLPPLVPSPQVTNNKAQENLG